MSRIVFCVFSYNRGRFLDNCISSVEHCAPGSEIIIFDDDSNDPETVVILDKLRQKHRVIQPSAMSSELGGKIRPARSKAKKKSKFGGLYNNMQMALDMLPDNQLFCFIQDDMQCTHRLTQRDIDDIGSFFDSSPKAAFLHPAFAKQINRKRYLKHTSWDAARKVYFRKSSGQSTGIHFSAIFISRTDILRKHDWHFYNRESTNDGYAAEVFGQMGFMKNPFCLWLPSIPVYRGKRKTFAIKMAEKLQKSGFYPVNYLDEQQAEAFRNRDPKVLPEAESFLTLRQGSLPQPWRYGPLENAKFLKKLSRLEVFISKLFVKG